MDLSWLVKLLGIVPKEEADGIRLQTAEPHWEVEGPRTFPALFETLAGFFPEDAVLYFEGGYPDSELEDFIAKHAIPERAHVALGTIWPRPKVFHLPASETVLAELAGIMEHHAEPELAVHFHVYRDHEVLLEWHDAFDQPLLLSASVPEEKVATLAHSFGKSFRRAPGRNPT